MARLIDADVLRKHMFSYYACVDENSSKEYYRGETLMSYEVADLIEDCIDYAPTVDAVEVVRCKDCKHRGSETYCPMCFEEWYEIDEGDGYYDSDITTHDRTIDEGFCDRGERKENEETNEERNAVG